VCVRHMGYAFFGAGDDPVLMTGMPMIAKAGVLENCAGRKEAAAARAVPAAYAQSRQCVWTTWDMRYDERA
jgi:hypothetical protein